MSKLRAKWFRRLVAVSRFFCFPIQMNFAEREKWPASPVWRATHKKSVGGYVRGGESGGGWKRPKPLAQPLSGALTGAAPTVPDLADLHCVSLHTSLQAPCLAAGGFTVVGRPPRKRLLRVHVVLGMPGIQRLGLAPTAAGWALWMAGRWSRLKPEQREATTRGGHRNGRSCVLSPPPGAPKSHRPPGHQCGGRTPWGTKRGKADCPKRRCRPGQQRFSGRALGRHPVTWNSLRR